MIPIPGMTNSNQPDYVLAQAQAQQQQQQQRIQLQQASTSTSTPTFQFNYSPSPLSSNSPSVPKPSLSSSKGKGPLAGGRQITRNRASYSCHTCRRRKVKCDKVHPVCGNCSKNGAECVYDTSPLKGPNSHNDQTGGGIGGGGGCGGHAAKRRRGSSRPLDEIVDDGDESHQRPGSSQAIKAKLERLTSMIERLSKTTTNQPLDPVDRQYLAQNNAKFDYIQRDSRPGDCPPSPRRAAADSSGDEFPIPSGHATDLVDPVGSLNLGHLSLEDGGRSRYVGTTYWAYISHEINELNQLLRDQNRSHNVPPRDESSNEETIAGQRTPGRSWKATPYSDPSGQNMGSSTFQKSVLFPSGDSPSVSERAVEPEMLYHVPSKRQSHTLYKGFMSGVHAISPVVHPPTILKLYNAFWDWYDYSSYSGESCPDPSFIPLLYAIWYGGSVTISIRTIQAEFNVSSRSALSKIYSEEVTRWLTKISFPRSPSLQGLAAYLLVQTILSKEEEPLTSSLFISLAMRVAQTMGLHRDPAQFGIGPCDAEYRRRLWWHIVHMDGVVAMSSGLPPLVSDENFWDVHDTSEVKDTLLGTAEADEYERLVATNMRPPDNPDDPTVCNGPSMVNVYYLSARGKYIMARAVRRILKIQLGTKPVTRRDMEELRSILLDLQRKLNSIINRIPDVSSVSSGPSPAFSYRSPVEMRSSDTELPGEGPTGCTEQYHSPVLVSFHKWARILLSLFIDKAFCVAYQPFLKNAKSRIWPAARRSALRHCHGFMEKFITLATDPDFQPFHWSWPGNHQPMHATMIMLIDLYERPYSPEASRSRAFIDKIFSLTGPDGGVVGGEDGITTARPLKDGGREAWDMIRRLRQKAWQKAGLDPNQLWTEQAQVQAGVASVAEDYRDRTNYADPYYYYPLKGNYDTSNSAAMAASTSQIPSRRPVLDRQFADFSRTFFNMTRTHMQPNPVSPMRPSPLRYSYPLPPPGPTSAPATPPLRALQQQQYPLSPTTGSNTITPATTAAANHLDAALALTSVMSSPESMTPLQATVPTITHQPALTTPPTSSLPSSFMDTSTSSATAAFPPPSSALSSPNPAQGLSVPTPPSMVDSSLNFDWDQWDAVFGQHLPVPDEFMEVDPVAGFEFGAGGGEYGGTTLSSSPAGRSLGGSPTAMGGSGGGGGVDMKPMPLDWEGYC